jgi:ComF family protein
MMEELDPFIDATMDTDSYTLISPVPLHPIRLRDRGFNQAMLLAEGVSHHFPNAELFSKLRRIRPTRVQSRLTNPNDRQSNVKGAFAVDRAIDLSGHRILLIDDVVTTGGTVSECAQALKRAGAAQVDVLAFALTVHEQG